MMHEAPTFFSSFLGNHGEWFIWREFKVTLESEIAAIDVEKL